MKQQFVVTHGYTILQETKTLRRSLIDQHLRESCFCEKIRTGDFFVWIKDFDRRRVCNPPV